MKRSISPLRAVLQFAAMAVTVVLFGACDSTSTGYSGQAEPLGPSTLQPRSPEAHQVANSVDEALRLALPILVGGGSTVSLAEITSISYVETTLDKASLVLGYDKRGGFDAPVSGDTKTWVFVAYGRFREGRDSRTIVTTTEALVIAGLPGVAGGTSNNKYDLSRGGTEVVIPRGRFPELDVARATEASSVVSEYGMELNIAQATDAVGGATFVVQAGIVHDGVTVASGCFNGPENGVDDDGDTAIDEADEVGLGGPLAVPPPGCYAGAQWHIDYDESLVDLLPLGSVANTGIARVASAPTLCNQRSDNGRRAYMACANIAPPPNAILAYTGPAFNLTFDCIATGTAVFTLVTTVGETFVSDGASDLPMHVHHDSIECTTEATETPTP